MMRTNQNACLCKEKILSVLEFLADRGRETLRACVFITETDLLFKVLSPGGGFHSCGYDRSEEQNIGAKIHACKNYRPYHKIFTLAAGKNTNQHMPWDLL